MNQPQTTSLILTDQDVRNCARKVYFATEQTARAQRVAHLPRNHAYRCKCCLGWHIGRVARQAETPSARC